MIPYPYISEMTYGDAVDMICEVGQLRVIDTPSGTPEFISARPIACRSELENAILIPNCYMMSQLSQTIIKKNKITSVNVQQNDIMQSWRSFENPRTISEFTFVSYSTSQSAYTNVLGNVARNPNITVLADMLPNENMGAGKNTWYYSIIKYNLPLPKTKLWKMKTNACDGWTYWVDDASPERSSKLLLEEVDDSSPVWKAGIRYFDASKTDKEIISNWVNFNADGHAETINKNAPNSSLNIRINNDGTIDAYWIFLVRIDSPQNTVRAVYGLHALEILYTNYSEKYTLSDGVYDYEITGNPLIQKGATYSDTEIADIIKNNIISDYKNGIATATVKMFCGDLYNSAKTKIKNWAAGEIIAIRDIVYFENDKNDDGSQKYWRVTGVEFNYDGTPSVDVELQEIYIVDKNE